MDLKKSPILKDVTALMLWYAPKRFLEKPTSFPDSFPCIAILAQSGDSPNIHSPMFGHSDEGIVYVYPDELKAPKRKTAKIAVKRSQRRSKAKRKGTKR